MLKAPLFAACDGAIAPLLGLGPTLDEIPWQVNAKELANHVAWTASTEMAHRLVQTSRHRPHGPAAP